MFKYLTIIGLICDFFGFVLLAYDIRLTVRDKITIDESLDRGNRRQKYLENKEKGILSKIIDFLKGRKEISLLVKETDKILYHYDIEKENQKRLKWGLRVIIIGFLLQIIGTIMD